MRTLYYIFLILLLSCTNKQANETDCNGIKQILITDKTNKPYNQQRIFTDNDILANFCQEIKQLQSVVKEPIVKVHFGLYLLDITYKDGEKKHIEIIYTKFDGVIIELDGKYYKNDALDTVMRGYLAPKEWQG